MCKEVMDWDGCCSYQGWARRVRKEEEEERKKLGEKGKLIPWSRTLGSKQQQRDGKGRESKGIPGPCCGWCSIGSIHCANPMKRGCNGDSASSESPSWMAGWGEAEEGRGVCSKSRVPWACRCVV
jgi:hypothetical protein